MCDTGPDDIAVDLSALALVLVGADHVLRDGDRVIRPAALVQRRRAAIPLLHIARSITLDSPLVEVGIPTSAQFSECPHELGGMDASFGRV
jgi:hypothetical protein